MLDIKEIRKNPEFYKTLLSRRASWMSLYIDDALELDMILNTSLAWYDECQMTRKQLAKKKYDA